MGTQRLDIVHGKKTGNCGKVKFEHYPTKWLPAQLVNKIEPQCNIENFHQKKLRIRNSTFESY